MSETGIYTKHQPVVREEMGFTVYHKHEVDDNFLFKKDNSISINAAILENSDLVTVEIPHRNVCVSARAKDIKNHSVVRTFLSETRYYYPVDLWRVDWGDEQWASKVIEDNKNNTLVFYKKSLNGDA